LHGQSKNVLYYIVYVFALLLFIQKFCRRYQLLRLLITPFRILLIFFVNCILVKALFATSELVLFLGFLFGSALHFFFLHKLNYLGVVVVVHFFTELCHQIGFASEVLVLVGLDLVVFLDYFWWRVSGADVDVVLFWIGVLVGLFVLGDFLFFKPCF